MEGRREGALPVRRKTIGGLCSPPAPSYFNVDAHAAVQSQSCFLLTLRGPAVSTLKLGGQGGSRLARSTWMRCLGDECARIVASLREFILQTRTTMSAFGVRIYRHACAPGHAYMHAYTSWYKLVMQSAFVSRPA